MIHGEDQNLKRIQKIEQFINKIGFYNKKKLEKKLDKNKWLKSLMDNQTKKESLLFGLDFEENISPKKNRRNKRRNIPYENITTQKRKQVIPIPSEKRLKELASIYTEFPPDQTCKIEATRFFLIKLLNKYHLPLRKRLIYNTTKKIIVLISKKNGFRWKK